LQRSDWHKEHAPQERVPYSFQGKRWQNLANQRQLANPSKREGETGVDLSAVLIITSEPATLKQLNETKNAVKHGTTRVTYSILFDASFRQDFTFVSPSYQGDYQDI